MPGQPGNAAIAGHRTTYGAPFFNLNELASGDHIFVTTAQGPFEYRVRETKVVHPSEVSVLDPTKDNRLTLTTCNPRFSASERLVVVADLLGTAAPAPPPSAVPEQPTTGVTTPNVPTTIPAFEGEGEAGNLSGKRSASWPTLWWGLLAGAIWLAAWVLSKKWRKWPAYAVGAPFFFLVLFVFYENVARLLPANF
jgi:sortase A